MNKKKVLILMGSNNDLGVMEETAVACRKLGLAYEMHIASAHRTPHKVHALVTQARARGFGVIVAGAGMAAHLAGAVAAQCLLPVIGVPLEASGLGGLDALLATVQMPRGFPVATVTIGKTGAYNAGVLAALILGLDDPELVNRLDASRKDMVQQVEEQDATLQQPERPA